MAIASIATGEDALEFLMAGARAVQIGTTNFAEPAAAVRVLAELRALMAELGIERVDDAVGCLRPHEPEPPFQEQRP